MIRGHTVWKRIAMSSKHWRLTSTSRDWQIGRCQWKNCLRRIRWICEDRVQALQLVQNVQALLTWCLWVVIPNVRLCKNYNFVQRRLSEVVDIHQTTRATPVF